MAFDNSRAPAACTSIHLASFAGNGLVADSGAITLPIPNRLSFWLSGLGDFSDAVEVEIDGYPHPRTYWASTSSPASEVLILSDEGASQSAGIWESITDITVRNLPPGATLNVYLFDFALPQLPDPLRPYIHYSDRGVEYTRGWSLQNSLLYEKLYAQPLARMAAHTIAIYFPTHPFPGHRAQYLRSYRRHPRRTALRRPPRTNSR